MNQEILKPNIKPVNPCFSSGPTAKRPGWQASNLNTNIFGRSHRCGIAKNRIADVISKSKKLLGLPDDYLLGIVPASDTGAVEMAMWSMLGERGVDVFAWESFGKDWVTDAVKQLQLDDLGVYEADYGKLPDFSVAKPDRDIVFTYNGTTSGVVVPNLDWIDDNRTGITICDATSAVFAYDIDWKKIDVLTYSWQKVMGGEAAHGVLILSPRAVARLENYVPKRPLPKIFRMTKGGKLNAGIFDGATINTPSLLAIEDAIDGLSWAEEIGGLSAMIARSKRNLSVVQDWVASHEYFDFLAEDKATISSTSICLKIIEPWYQEQSEEVQKEIPKKLVKLLEAEGAAYDIGAYRDAPAGLRLWGGATVDSDDLKIALLWIDWGYLQLKNQY